MVSVCKMIYGVRR